mmetsp:Transcript_131423/g.420630  ORF Transcript_131423/g.420630 Transcript_131423/m.420630 type:complete len:363 (+) Transcript_131423:379-1467(+)
MLNVGGFHLHERPKPRLAPGLQLRKRLPADRRLRGKCHDGVRPGALVCVLQPQRCSIATGRRCPACRPGQLPAQGPGRLGDTHDLREVPEPVACVFEEHRATSLRAAQPGVRNVSARPGSHVSAAEGCHSATKGRLLGESLLPRCHSAPTTGPGPIEALAGPPSEALQGQPTIVLSLCSRPHALNVRLEARDADGRPQGRHPFDASLSAHAALAQYIQQGPHELLVASSFNQREGAGRELVARKASVLVSSRLGAKHRNHVRGSQRPQSLPLSPHSRHPQHFSEPAFGGTVAKPRDADATSRNSFRAAELREGGRGPALQLVAAALRVLPLDLLPLLVVLLVAVPLLPSRALRRPPRREGGW